jgi:hypothetical protein
MFSTLTCPIFETILKAPGYERELSNRHSPATATSVTQFQCPLPYSQGEGNVCVPTAVGTAVSQTGKISPKSEIYNVKCINLLGLQ